jgi:branched-chain amino acid aminotransferase
MSKIGGRVVYMNGRLVPEAEARLSIYDSALMFGDMVFEMTRSFRGVQFRLRQHLERLYASARFVAIDIPLSIDEMEGACRQTIAANAAGFASDDEHRLMINVSRGLLSLYAGKVDAPVGANIIIADFPLRWTVAAMAPLFDWGINAVIPSQRAIPAQLLEPKVKNRSRLHYMMANIEVSRVKGDNNWALMLDPDGFVAEGTGANFFLVSKGRLLTPEPRNILRGVSRDYVIEIAGELGIPVEERNLEPYDVMAGDEAFFTATPFCILPVTHFQGRALGEGAMGPITRTLLDRWSENVGVDIIRQIKSWAGSVNTVQGPTPYQFAAGR